MGEPVETAAKDSVEGKLDPAAENLLDSIRASGFPGWSSLPLDHARAAILQMKSLAGEPETVARVEDISIPGADSAKILARLYIPESRVPTPVMVYMHGGGGYSETTRP
jgi:acetyl esterase